MTVQNSLKQVTFDTDASCAALSTDRMHRFKPAFWVTHLHLSGRLRRLIPAILPAGRAPGANSRLHK